MTAFRRTPAPGAAARQGNLRWHGLQSAALTLPEGIAFRLLEAAALRRVFSPRRGTLESEALHVVEKAALNVLDWVAVRSVR